MSNGGQAWVVAVVSRAASLTVCPTLDDDGRMSTEANAGAVPAVTLGWRLQMSLRQSGVSVQQMANELGLGRSTLSRWMNDHAPEPPRAAYLKVWALRTGVPYEWLSTGAAPTTKGPGPGVSRDRGNKLPRLDSSQEPSDSWSLNLAA